MFINVFSGFSSSVHGAQSSVKDEFSSKGNFDRSMDITAKTKIAK